MQAQNKHKHDRQTRMSSLFFLPTTSPLPLTKEKLHFFDVTTLWRQDNNKQHRFDIVCPPYRLSVSKSPSQGVTIKPTSLNIDPQSIDLSSFDPEYCTAVLSYPNKYVVLQDEAVPNEISIKKDINKRVGEIKSILKSLSDGEISISAYDTAWVALIENDNGKPLFPSSLRWIVDNQLPDGSWGDPYFFSAQDRSISTLACLVALKTWNIHPEMCDRGMLFLEENLPKIEDEKSEHMLIGFEVAFPSIVEKAQELGIQVLPKNSPLLRDIYAKREQKLNRIPKEKMHKEPTSLLFSLEGLKLLGLNWKDLLRWQSSDGSFLTSLSSTAFAFMQSTRDPNCFNFLNKVVHRFNGGVPHTYPVDTFEHFWVVDRLQRLGISQYFKEEIKECMGNISRYWTEQGLFSGRNSPISDLDDTAMGFRLLRFHGHQVSADVFEQFKSGSNFYTFKGQSSESITVMFNLLRASQVQFPGEEILKDAKRYSTRFLTEKRAANQLFDKWIITKDLPGEVGYGLDVPWYASLPRVEARFYIEHYGGADDVWIGKTLYRMPNVNNNKYLELAKLDYNNCQALHISEWDHIQRWYSQSDIGELGISGKSLLLAYFVTSSSIYEAERSSERIVWAKTSILVDTIASFFGTTFTPRSRAFVREFKTASAKGKWVPNKVGQGLVGTLVSTLNELSLDMLVTHGQDMYSPLRDAWVKWLVRWEEDGDKNGGLAELLVQSINIAGGRHVSSQPPNRNYQRLTQLSDQLISRHLGPQISFSSTEKVQEKSGLCSEEVESAMQELVQMVLCDDDGMDKEVKQTFLTVVKSFYYTAFFDPATIDFHISKVLFDKVIN